MHYRANVQIWQLLTNAVAKVAMGIVAAGDNLTVMANFALNLAGTPRSLMKNETDFVEKISIFN